MSIRPRIAVVGSINIDYVASAPHLPAPGETVSGGVLEVVAGGKGANQAVAASRLGADVVMFGAVGADASATIARDALAAAGVDASRVREVADVATGTALITVDAAGENMITVCDGANAEVSADEAALVWFDAVLVQLEIPMDAVRAAARGSAGFFAVNAAPAHPLPAEVRDRADLIVANENEYALLDRPDEIEGIIAVTRGAAGAVLLRRGEVVAEAPSPRVEAVSSVGAGDAFCAALVVGLARGDEPGAALRTACNVGAAAVRDRRSQPLFESLDRYRDGV